MSDKLTILRCAPSLVLAKVWKADGSIEPYSRAKTFSVEQREVADIFELSIALEELQGDPRACVIRGTPKVSTPHTGVRRLIEHFDDTPLHTVLIEVDQYQPLLSDPLLDPEEAALEYVAECLPKPFQGASFHWQLSNSAGAPGNESKLKGHLWFWLSTPYDSATLRAWARSTKLQVDLSVLNPVQVHFTSLPIFEEGRTDPIVQRSNFYRGARDFVDLKINIEDLDVRHQGVRQRGERRAVADPLADWLETSWETWGTLPDGGLLVSCPWEQDHSSGQSGDTSSVYFPAGTNSYSEGAFVCLHNSCRDKGRSQFAQAVGYGEQRLAALAETPPTKVTIDGTKVNGVHVFDPLVLPPFARRTAGGAIMATVGNTALATSSPRACGHRLRYDTFRGEMVIASPDVEDWRPFADADAVAMRITLGKVGFEPISKEMMRDAITVTARDQQFDTAIHWLTHEVPEWDGISRIERFYPDYFKTDDTPYTRACGLYVWTAHAGRVMDPGCQADMAPILVGQQGLRKSTGVAAMSPDPAFFAKIDLDLKDADLSRSVRGVLVGEMDELKGLAGRESEAIRAWITKRYERWTPKFQEYGSVFPRRLLLHGTTNRDDVLTDDTGERRWLPMRVRHMVEVDAIAEDRLQLWAEGLARWQAGGVEWEDAERLARLEHGQFKEQDPWEGAILQWLDEPDMAQETPRDREWLTVHQVAEGALAMPKRQIGYRDHRRITKVLRQVGYRDISQRVNGTVTKVWTLKEVEG